MGVGLYQRWRAQLDGSLERRAGRFAAAPSSDEPLVLQIARIVGEARHVIESINAIDGSIQVSDKTKYDFVLGMLDKLLTFDEFVLAEYTYQLAEGQRPGIRLLLEREAGHRQISVILFEDTQIWQVDWEGQRVSYQLLRLELGPKEPVARFAEESQEYFDPAWSWSEHLREALCLPVRLLTSRSAPYAATKPTT